MHRDIFIISINYTNYLTKSNVLLKNKQVNGMHVVIIQGSERMYKSSGTYMAREVSRRTRKNVNK